MWECNSSQVAGAGMQTQAGSGVPVHHVLWCAAGSPKGWATAQQQALFALGDGGPLQVPNIAASIQGFFTCPVTMVCWSYAQTFYISRHNIFPLFPETLRPRGDHRLCSCRDVPHNVKLSRILIWKKTWIDPSLHKKANNAQNLNSLEIKDNPAALLKSLITDSRSLGHFTLSSYCKLQNKQLFKMADISKSLQILQKSLEYLFFLNCLDTHSHTQSPNHFATFKVGIFVPLARQVWKMCWEEQF